MPEGLAAKAFHAASALGASRRSFSQCAGLAMNRLVRLIGRMLSGSLVTSATVRSSTFSARRRVGMRVAVRPTWRGS